jgi:hypothetical protein
MVQDRREKRTSMTRIAALTGLMVSSEKKLSDRAVSPGTACNRV